jgi:hypothetical protein
MLHAQSVRAAQIDPLGLRLLLLANVEELVEHSRSQHRLLSRLRLENQTATLALDRKEQPLALRGGLVEGGKRLGRAEAVVEEEQLPAAAVCVLGHLELVRVTDRLVHILEREATCEHTRAVHIS